MPGVATPASLVRRINATTLDLLVWVAIIGAAQAIPGDGAPLQALRVAGIFAPVLLLDPLLIRLTGATVGQRWLELRTAPLALGARLTLPRLVLRYWLKLLLGFVSLAYVVFSGRRQALHDRLFGTIVWHAPAGAAIPPAGTWHAPPPDPALPPAWRRFAVFIAWSLVAQTLFVFSFAVAFYGLYPSAWRAVSPRSGVRLQRRLDRARTLAVVSRRDRAAARRAPTGGANARIALNRSHSARFRFAPVRIA